MIVLALSASAVACGPSKTAAASYLESQGMRDITLVQKGNSFDFTAMHDAEYCTGTVTVSKGVGTSSSLMTKSCGPDVRACKPGVPAECVRLADELYAKDEKVFPDTAAELYRTACADKNGHACGRAGQYAVIEKDYVSARKLAEQGCNLDDPMSCGLFGAALVDGEGGAKDPERGLEMLKKGCNGTPSFPRACRAVAGTLLDRTPADNTGALPFAEKACAAKYNDGCTVLGLAQFRTKDYVRALANLEPACAAETKFTTRGLACNLTGAIVFDGLGATKKKDLAKGLEMFEKACDAGDEDGCTNASRSYAKGLGTPRDPAKAKQFAVKACKAGKGSDCEPT